MSESICYKENSEPKATFIHLNYSLQLIGDQSCTRYMKDWQNFVQKVAENSLQINKSDEIGTSVFLSI